MAATELYDALVEICRERRTSREFDPSVQVPREHFDMILEAARHAPSGANTQPWHYIVVTESAAKAAMADYFIAEATRRAKLGMKFPTPNYRGLATAPGVIVVVADFRWIVKRLSILTPDQRAKLTPLSGTAEVVPVVNRGDPRGFV